MVFFKQFFPSLDVAQFKETLLIEKEFSSRCDLSPETLETIQAIAFESLPKSGKISRYTEKKVRKLLEDLILSAPKSTKTLQLNNITSIPNVPSIFSACSFPKIFKGPIWSTDTKERDYDLREREQVEGNLKNIFQIEKPEWIDLLEGQHDHKLILSLEQLAIAYVYHTPQPGETIKIATENGLIEYQIEEIEFCSGMKAYGFTPLDPKEAKPLLIFKGTSAYPAGRAAASTILADLDPSGIGHRAYLEGSQRIKNWLKGKEGVIASGYSLGSAFASEAIADNPNKISTIYTFGSVLVGKGTAKKIQRLELSNRCFKFYGSKDRVCQFGQQGAGVELEVHQNPNDDLPENEKGNAWRLKTWEHRKSCLHRRCVVIKKDQPRSCRYASLLKPVLAISYFSVWFFLTLKRGIFGARGQKNWRQRLWSYPFSQRGFSTSFKSPIEV